MLTYDNTIDYLATDVDGKISFVPTSMTVNINLRPQYNPSRIRDEFTVDGFRQGNYIGKDEGLL